MRFIFLIRYFHLTGEKCDNIYTYWDFISWSIFFFFFFSSISFSLCPRISRMDRPYFHFDFFFIDIKQANNITWSMLCNAKCCLFSICFDSRLGFTYFIFCCLAIVGGKKICIKSDPAHIFFLSDTRCSVRSNENHN